jgi:hypothetical protein
MIPENIYRATLKLDYVMSSDAFGVRVSVPEDLLIYTIFTKSDNITPNRQFVRWFDIQCLYGYLFIDSKYVS